MFGGVLASTWYVDYKAHVELRTRARKTRVHKRRADAAKTAASGLAQAAFGLLAGVAAFFRREEEAFAAA